jgi:hypothetical protein
MCHPPPRCTPEAGVIYRNQRAPWIYGSGNNPNTGVSWWDNGNGCNENSSSITINNICTYDASNRFGQGITGSRYLYVYVQP